MASWSRGRVATLTGLPHSQLNGWILALLPLEAQDLPLPVALAGLLLNLLLRLAVEAQQPRAEHLVEPQEDVPVVVAVQQVVGVVQPPQLLGPRAAEQQLGLAGSTPRQAVVLLNGLAVCRHCRRCRLLFVLVLFLVVILFLGVRELAAPREQHVGDEVVDDLLDLVLVLLLDAHLSLDVVDGG